MCDAMSFSSWKDLRSPPAQNVSPRPDEKDGAKAFVSGQLLGGVMQVARELEADRVARVRTVER